MSRTTAGDRLAAWQAASPLPELVRSPSVTGAGARVTMLDTGVDAALLESRHPGCRLECPPDAVPASHGTLVADILLSVAPGISLRVADIFAGKGSADPERLVGFLEDHLGSPREQILHCSLGWPEERWDTPLGRSARQKITRLVELAYEQGTCVVAAAHNDHPLARSCPADRAPPLVGVAAGDWDDPFRVDYHGDSWVEFSARGTANIGVLGRRPASSWAAAHVSALAARLLELRRGLRPFEIKAWLKASSTHD